ncbi:MAG: hypothetical protein A3E80_05910 [Chlamydiae bacterium RIFCSPHIGHO2_12_FULL_49_9]|nr:MAG: hypothetical protein A3E80_05910 [Chlamydiae bacterium RIFCSPHIGHO2_12_FULL_49_9]
MTEALNPEDKKLYMQEYKHAADLFERAAKEAQKSDNPYQKEAFKQVMDRAMHVLEETAGELAKPNLLKHNQKIAEDFEAYKKDAPQSFDQLVRDLEKAKKSV